MNESEPISEADPIQEELVAYLDGELDAEASQRVERRLAEDAQYRQRLHDLQQTWDLLDHLPRSPVSESFTQTTVQMVAVKASEDVEKKTVTADTKRRTMWLIGAGGAAAAAMLGYVIVSELVSRPNVQLVKDLPVIEYVDVYQHADSIEFLKQLDQAGLFSEDVGDAL
jgi:anti-sigma factor RsiW